MKPWIIHIGSGQWQQQAIIAMKQRGYKNLAVDGNPHAAGFVHADDTLVTDILNPSLTLHTVINYCLLHKIVPNAIFSIANEVGQVSAATLRQHFALAGVHAELAMKLTNKALQRQLYQGQRFSPHYQVFDTNLLDRLIPSHFPDGFLQQKLIVKPVDASGSRGITIVAPSEINELRQAAEYASHCSRTKKIIVEQFIEGQEYTLESVIIEGRTHPLLITKKVQGNCGTVSRMLMTAELPNLTKQAIYDTVANAHRLLQYENGISHAEIIVDNNKQVWIVEVAGRGAGWAVSEKFIEFATGYHYFDASLAFNLGERIEIPSSIQPSSCCIRFFETQSGELIELSIPQIEGVYGEQILLKGAKMHDAKTDNDRIGFAMLKANCNKQLIEKLDHIEAQTQVVLKTN
ncbi:ATP-grasp domain-containing protein [Parashewanella spongiae]|uniref:ATP-grasp domain-containing protein n=1 Tax=Parashewanella spongiae TaxID=342950 RepID=A0A3A6UBD7_9GAMM|nr:ATP-grasp domain-containing protein [Parashewanella spongiae]MCL1076771.1 ATP-grasp domain-containing protein [Parashewanella spongiae]RJY19304.1 ATP-grasp domain-containing protein [Parashewanella spongiae]